MNILVIGRGGREHAVCQKLSESESVNRVFCAPGSEAMRQAAQPVPIDEMNFSELVKFVRRENVDLTIVGPENPLLAGIVDYFQEQNLAIFGPTQAAAEIEGSKAFAKNLMKKYDIPTAQYETFTDLDKAKRYIEKQGLPIVIKADGLAAGKGVVIPTTLAEAFSTLEEMLVNQRFGEASSKVVIEEFLKGEEFSFMSLVNGEKVYPMAIAQDHKRAFDGDQGPNTGGMGAYSPVPHITDEVLKTALDRIVKPVAEALVKEKRLFSGVLYAGLILTEQGPKVIEFNARFGDPETQVVLPRLKNDLGSVFCSVLTEEDVTLEWEPQAVLGVVLASKGYPNEYATGIEVEGLRELSKETLVFHAGTKIEKDKILSNGGRVLLVGVKADSIQLAYTKVYKELMKLSIDPFFYRSDIGKRAITGDVSSFFEHTQIK
ncbi:phosphoribosylamine--glycine ligase [Bacillus sp. 2205SS5-2]|uniref:phosphoribosylamine--glycine ligase n=1 Tax=Bacillus sp. 2205SS5-2 TaxID=3109031 RepID=UPI0030044FC9